MSYLGLPRLVFAGQFQADPSTVNNDPEHFDTDRFRSDYQLVSGPNMNPPNGWWNPDGSGAWRFFGCTVQRVYYGDGCWSDNPADDPIVGSAVSSNDAGVEAKLVDLDPEQQMVSMIFGLLIIAGGGGSPGFRGDFRPAAFANIWPRYPQGQPDSFFGAFYQSVLESVTWDRPEGSRFLKELSAAAQATGKLSIKFNVDGYQDDRSRASFTFGRVVGSIGVHGPGEPSQFVAARLLNPGPGSTPALPLNTAYAAVQGDVVTVDLGNSLPTTAVGGPFAALGTVALALLAPDPAASPHYIGELPYTNPGWYASTAGIVSMRIPKGLMGPIAGTPLALLQPNAQTFPPYSPLLVEAPDGSWLRADDFVFRLDPGTTSKTTFYARQFGQPWAKAPIALGYDATSMKGQITQGPTPGPSPVGLPEKALAFATSLTTGGDGTAELTLTASDPGNQRAYIDGQLYGVTYAPGNAPPPLGSVQDNSLMLSALVFSGYQASEVPTWLRDVRPIFQQYADLYPVMKPFLDLGDFGAVVRMRKLLRNVFAAPITDPNAMPVTRDLSAAKRAMLLKWLDRPLYMRIESADDLQAALQVAIELEHSTIPPYLTAYYSIKPGANVEVAQLIYSVVIEEMYHMAQVCNLMIAIGGRPRIGHPRFVPRYPGPLPGGLRSGLTVRLRKCSIEQVRDVFMSIEDPHLAREAIKGHVGPDDPVDVFSQTIAWFYGKLRTSIVRLARAGTVQFGNTERQLAAWPGSEGRPETKDLTLKVITDVDGAVAAIDAITEQGAGIDPADPDTKAGELAHYFKFAEIVAGRRIVRNTTGFSYDGDKIPFDPDGVYPMMDDPEIGKLQPGSKGYILSSQFAQTYQALLRGLDRTFGGEPGAIAGAVGTMYSLDVTARQLMQAPTVRLDGSTDGSTAGPSFQLPYPG
jgi:Ferritin-like